MIHNKPVITTETIIFCGLTFSSTLEAWNCVGADSTDEEKYSYCQGCPQFGLEIKTTKESLTP